MASCANCGNERAPHVCARCKSVAYCDTSCQRVHWKQPTDGHRRICASLAESRVRRIAPDTSSRVPSVFATDTQFDESLKYKQRSPEFENLTAEERDAKKAAKVIARMQEILERGTLDSIAQTFAAQLRVIVDEILIDGVPASEKHRSFVVMLTNMANEMDAFDAQRNVFSDPTGVDMYMDICGRNLVFSIVANCFDHDTHEFKPKEAVEMCVMLKYDEIRQQKDTTDEDGDELMNTFIKRAESLIGPSISAKRPLGEEDKLAVAAADIKRRAEFLEGTRANNKSLIIRTLFALADWFAPMTPPADTPPADTPSSSSSRGRSKSPKRASSPSSPAPPSDTIAKQVIMVGQMFRSLAERLLIFDQTPEDIYQNLMTDEEQTAYNNLANDTLKAAMLAAYAKWYIKASITVTLLLLSIFMVGRINTIAYSNDEFHKLANLQNASIENIKNLTDTNVPRIRDLINHVRGNAVILDLAREIQKDQNQTASAYFNGLESVMNQMKNVTAEQTEDFETLSNLLVDVSGGLSRLDDAYGQIDQKLTELLNDFQKQLNTSIATLNAYKTLQRDFKNLTPLLQQDRDEFRTFLETNATKEKLWDYREAMHRVFRTTNTTEELGKIHGLVLKQCNGLDLSVTEAIAKDQMKSCVVAIESMVNNQNQTEALMDDQTKNYEKLDYIHKNHVDAHTLLSNLRKDVALVYDTVEKANTLATYVTTMQDDLRNQTQKYTVVRFKQDTSAVRNLASAQEKNQYIGEGLKNVLNDVKQIKSYATVMGHQLGEMVHHVQTIEANTSLSDRLLYLAIESFQLIGGWKTMDPTHQFVGMARLLASGLAYPHLINLIGHVSHLCYEIGKYQFSSGSPEEKERARLAMWQAILSILGRIALTIGSFVVLYGRERMGFSWISTVLGWLKSCIWRLFDSVVSLFQKVVNTIFNSKSDYFITQYKSGIWPVRLAMFSATTAVMTGVAALLYFLMELGTDFTNHVIQGYYRRDMPENEIFQIPRLPSTTEIFSGGSFLLVMGIGIVNYVVYHSLRGILTHTMRQLLLTKDITSFPVSTKDRKKSEMLMVQVAGNKRYWRYYWLSLAGEISLAGFMIYLNWAGVIRYSVASGLIAIFGNGPISETNRQNIMANTTLRIQEIGDQAVEQNTVIQTALTNATDAAAAQPNPCRDLQYEINGNTTVFAAIMDGCHSETNATSNAFNTTVAGLVMLRDPSLREAVNNAPIFNNASLASCIRAANATLLSPNITDAARI